MKKTNQRNKYQKHTFSNLDAIIKDLEAAKTKEGKKMFSTLYPAIIQLQNKKINTLKNITALFKDCGFNTNNTSQIIFFLLQKLDINLDIQKRIIKKMNNSYRNVILNYLFNDFSDRIIILIDEFTTKNCPNIHNHDFLIDQLKQQIKPGNDEFDGKLELNINNKASKNNILIKNHIHNIHKETNILDSLNNSYLSLIDLKEDDDYSEFNADNIEI